MLNKDLNVIKLENARKIVNFFEKETCILSCTNIKCVECPCSTKEGVCLAIADERPNSEVNLARAYIERGVN